MNAVPDTFTLNPGNYPEEMHERVVDWEHMILTVLQPHTAPRLSADQIAKAPKSMKEAIQSLSEIIADVRRAPAEGSLIVSFDLDLLGPNWPLGDEVGLDFLSGTGDLLFNCSNAVNDEAEKLKEVIDAYAEVAAAPKALL